MSAASPLIAVFMAMLGVMTLAWVVQRALNNAGWVDVFWTFGTGGACATAALWPGAANPARQYLVAALALAWCLRLGLYVATRVVSNHSEDVRYAAARKDWGQAFQARMFWLAIVQAPAAALLALSVFAATHLNAGPLGARDFLGVAILGIGIFGETLADEQMRRFKTRAKSGVINDQGLWSWSRHPNYFFEWVGWLAYPLIGFSPESAASWLTLIAPALMYLLLRYATGVPALENTMLKSRGEAFRAYQARVSAFIPLPPKRTPK